MTKPKEVHLEVLRIDEVGTPSDSLHIDVIDTNDTNEDAMEHFFQGLVAPAQIVIPNEGKPLIEILKAHFD